MDWIRLSSLPQQRVDSREYSFNYWKIECGTVYHQGRPLRKADPKTFEVRSDYSQVFVGRDQNNVFYAWSMVAKIDRNSFSEVGGGYWEDMNAAYYEYETSIRPLKGSSVDSFDYVGGSYARDADFGYYAGRMLKSCKNPMELELMDSTDCWFAGDGKSIWFDGVELKNADFASWQRIEGPFSKDKNTVFFAERKLPFVRATSWRIIAENYSRDERNVYSGCFRLKGADPDSWQFLGYGYSKDRSKVYYGNDVIESADVDTFEVIGERRGRDKNHVFDGPLIASK